MSPTRQPAIRRIQKLKALAEKTEGHEAASAARLAQALMIRHEIASFDLDAVTEAEDPLVRRRVSLGRQLTWLRGLYHAVAKASNCSTSYVTGTDRVTLYGRESDCEIAEYLAVHLAREVQTRADAHIRRLRSAYGHTPRGERSSFCWSAVVVLGRRLSAMRREAAEEARAQHGDAAVSTALVRIDNRLAEAQAFADRFTTGSGRATHYTSNGAGYRAGRAININRGVAGGDAAPAQLESC